MLLGDAVAFIEFGFPLIQATFTVVKLGFTLIRGLSRDALTLVGFDLPTIRDPLTLVGFDLPTIRDALTLVGFGLPTIRDALTVVGFGLPMVRDAITLVGLPTVQTPRFLLEEIVFLPPGGLSAPPSSQSTLASSLSTLKYRRRSPDGGIPTMQPRFHPLACLILRSGDSPHR